MSISGFFKGLVHLVVIWIVNAISLAIGAWILPGIDMVESGTAMDWVAFTMGTALVLALVNMVVRPIVLRFAVHLNWVWTMVIGFLVNAVALWITAWIVPGFDVSILAGLFGGIVIAFINTVLLDIFHVNSEGSWYQKRIEKLAAKDPFDHADEPGRGLMMVEIDGLSYWHIQKAIDEGLMPTMKAMMESEDYHLTRVECGLPSMTSSCQAGIMFGDNYDIPAYRWWDKSKKKLYVSASDAAELNDRYAHGQGLMRQGSSIMNMMDGDAEKSMFTMSTMKTGSPEEQRRRSQDVALLCLDPFFLLHELALFFFEVGRELWQAWQQKRHNVEPRLNRLKDWYPFVRAGCCTIMRDMSAELAKLDMMRGAPSIYMLYLGYDEVAHHSGPWTSDAFGDLKHLDKTFARIKHVVDTKAKRPYDFVILSDHGQSFGATFKQRYGLSIKDFIEQQLPTGTTVSAEIGGDRGASGLVGVAGQLGDVSNSDAGNAVSRSVAKQGQKLAQKGADVTQVASEGPEAAVTAYGSGNAAQVYFHNEDRKILLSELNRDFPGVVDALIAHEGIGLVVGYADDGTAVAMGKEGSRNVHTGEVVGLDPLIAYAPDSGYGACSLETRIWQVKRGHGLPQRRRSLAHQHPLRGRHRGRAGGVGRQPWRHGRSPD